MCLDRRRPAVFLDRDGVINRDRADFVKSWAELELLPGALAALRCLAAAEVAVVIVTNQSCVGRGLLSLAALHDIHARLLAAIEREGGRVDGVFFCPHRPEDHCPCRKPRPGLLLRAADELRLDLAASWLVGDAERDISAAVACGVRPLLVLTGKGAAQRGLIEQTRGAPVPVLSDIHAAAGFVLENMRHSTLGAGAW
ncbi:MAG: D-glycero-beta-D-manno-heptose 1,7-bisphosphate 7-phosphatase [Candidatus Schekmanbacteria bacterium]|nr:D-glycero-beta-D-manno-heptose 1,7-bisphosphate 7-phosphatase [Candidatus Schekmanbacteria bacterium]